MKTIGNRRLTHVSERGTPRMVDVSDKPSSVRIARAAATVRMKPSTLKLIERMRVRKGDVLVAAQLAGICAAKLTPQLIPLCHGISLTQVEVECRPRRPDRVEITATSKACDRTGAEMEALVAAAIAALTVYDMCKSADREMIVSDIMLLEKSGGESGRFVRSKMKGAR
jgi:cyclic pyranopterin phosphate synthase